MYKPPPRADGRSLEFVELYNSNPYFEDIGGWRLSGEIDFTFPTNQTIAGNAFIIVAKDPTAFTNIYGGPAVFGPYFGSLKTAGTLRLRGEQDEIRLEINYSDKAPWPVGANDTGHSIVLARPSYGENYPEAWDLSDRPGGSPRVADSLTGGALRNVTINEFLAHTDDPLLDYIELYNHSAAAVNLAGCMLTDDPLTNKHVLPAGTTIPARGYLVLDQSQLGFALDAAGETIYFKDTTNRVIEAVRFDAQDNGVSMGRYPDGASEFYPLAVRSPGTSNGPIRIADVVINELMYDPVTGSNDDEFIELYNQGTSTVNLAGWNFTSGVSFTFPSNAMILPGSYLVVAKSVTNLLAKYPQLNTANTYGDYGGSLGNKGERVALAKPDVLIRTNATNALLLETNLVHVVVDEVTYRTGGNWPGWANGGGSSLELTDPRSNHRLAYNWADSDETTKAPWTTIEYTGVLDNGAESPNDLQLYLMGEGECLVDNVECFASTNGPNLVSNSGFESGLGSNWSVWGTHIRSFVRTNEGYQSLRSLQIRASARGDSLINRVYTPLTSALTVNGTATIHAKARWLRGWPELLLRTHGNYLEASGRMVVPGNLGTPGQRNSRAITNAPPAIYEVSHSPVVPAANQAVVVTARVHDPDGIGSFMLYYRLDPSTTYTAVSMRDDGTAGDTLAGDGVFSGLIPGQSGGTLVAFYLRASDAATPPAASVFPLNAPQFEALVRFGEPIVAGGFGTYRQWLTQAAVNSWVNRPVLSNERIYGTFVCGEFRVIYNMSSRYSGSPYHQGFTSPVSSGCHYSIELPLDDLFLGTENFNKVHAPGNGPFDDASLQREQTAYYLARKTGVPWNNRRYVHMIVNGNRRGAPNAMMEDTETPGSDVVDSRFPNDPNGHLYKLQPWFETDQPATPQTQSIGFRNNSWCILLKYTTTSNGVTIYDTARYRNNYLTRAAQGTANDYWPVFDLVETANTALGPAYEAGLKALIDLEQWQRTFAIEHACGNWDSYGWRNSQNMYGYKPQNGKWRLLIWDYNIVLNNPANGGTTSEGPGVNLFEANVSNPGDTIMQRFYTYPAFRRNYLRILKDVADRVFDPDVSTPLMDAKYNAFVAAGLSPTQPTSIKTFIANARASIRSQVAAENTTNFALTVTNYIVISNNLVTLSGIAPVEARTILFNGVEYPLTWTDVRSWRLQLPLSAVSNHLAITGHDTAGQPLPGMTAAVTVIYTGAVPAPEQNVIISEIMYRPSIPGANYIEICNRHPSFSFDLSNWRINGTGYTFPVGSVLTNGQYLVLVKDPTAFHALYPALPSYAGVFSGDLDPDGETLTLFRPGSTPNTEIVVNRVRYEPAAPWPEKAADGGMAAQVLDTSQDNARASNWSDGVGWHFFTYTGVPGGNGLVLYLNTLGDVYVDDFMMVTGSVAEAGVNLIQNGGFEEPLQPAWTIVGTRATNTVISSEALHSGSHSLHIVFNSAGGAGQYIAQPNADIVATGTYTLSFWYLPSANANSLIARYGISFRPTIDVHQAPGTPGQPTGLGVTLPPYPPVWLNEAQPINLSGITDNAGQREPWIELFNAGTTPLSLDGWFLADNYHSNLTAWAFPAGATLNPGALKVVWADGQPQKATPTDWHTSFRLSAANSQVALTRLVNGTPQIVDYLTCGTVGADLSYGDFPDGQPFYRYVLAVPTPGATNGAPPAAVAINEWMAGNTNFLINPATGRYDDWFELYNAGTNLVDLDGYYLSDNPGQKTKFRIPAGYSLPPRSFLLVWADDEPQHNGINGPDLHVNFQLARAGDEIGLYAPDGVTVIDQITFGAQTNDISQGRYGDGAANIVFMTNPTPRLPNLYDSANHPPTVDFIPDQFVTLGQTLAFAVSAYDPDGPPQTLTFALDPGYPLGLAIDPGSGFVTWTPGPQQAPSTNQVTIRVSDDGQPALTATATFRAHVILPPKIYATLAGGNIWLQFATVPGHTYRAEYKTDLGQPQWLPFGADFVASGYQTSIADSLAAVTQKFYRITQLD